jgi:hypothetical protein
MASSVRLCGRCVKAKRRHGRTLRPAAARNLAVATLLPAQRQSVGRLREDAALLDKVIVGLHRRTAIAQRPRLRKIGITD